jgi:hypothetical protein
MEALVEVEHADGLGGAAGAAPYLSVFEWVERVSDGISLSRSPAPLCPPLCRLLRAELAG